MHGNPKIAIAVVQMDCVVGETAPNLNKIRHFAGLAANLGADLAIFPECCTTGYFVGDRLSTLAEPDDGATAKQLGDIARDRKLHLAIGMFTKDGNAIRNSQLLFAPDGKRLATYHKTHLFASEREFCRPGDHPVVADTALGKIGMTICYDLIFPEYLRRPIEMGADFIINSTDWIHDAYQRDIWGFNGERILGLVSTRALENGTVFAMANRVGHEVAAPGIEFDSFGHSCVASPSGRILASLSAGEGVAVAKLDIADADLERWRSIATYRRDRRPELYR
jgi:predicted amidohydrolase